MSSAAPKKKSFDRGGPVWPPRSNVTNDRLRGGSLPLSLSPWSGGLCPPSQKPGGLGGSAPQPKPRNPKMKKPENECNWAAKVRLPFMAQPGTPECGSRTSILLSVNCFPWKSFSKKTVSWKFKSFRFWLGGVAAQTPQFLARGDGGAP